MELPCYRESYHHAGEAMALTEYHQSQAGNATAQYPRGSRDRLSDQGREMGGQKKQGGTQTFFPLFELWGTPVPNFNIH